MGDSAALIIASAGVAAGVFAQQQAARRARRQQRQYIERDWQQLADLLMPDRHASQPGPRLTPRQRVLRQAEEELRQIRHETAMAAYPSPMTATEVLLRQREFASRTQHHLDEAFVAQYGAEMRAALGLQPELDDAGIGYAAPAREQLQGIAPPLMLQDMPEEMLRHLELRPGHVFMYRGEEIRFTSTSNEDALAAEMRAKVLLLDSLSEEQKEHWIEKSYFMAQGNISGMWYKIKPGREGNIEDGKGAGYCITARGFLPMSDIVLSQKLLIEGDEDAFLAIARKSERARPTFAQMLRGVEIFGERDG